MAEVYHTRRCTGVGSDLFVDVRYLHNWFLIDRFQKGSRPVQNYQHLLAICGEILHVWAEKALNQVSWFTSTEQTHNHRNAIRGTPAMGHTRLCGPNLSDVRLFLTRSG